MMVIYVSLYLTIVTQVELLMSTSNLVTMQLVDLVVQLKQKLLVLARKILHLQRNMEQQVGVNTHFKSGFKEVASHLPAGVDDSAGGGKNKTERRKMWEEGEADLRQRYDEAEQKVVAEIAPLAPRGQKLAADLKNDDGLQTARILDTNENMTRTCCSIQ